MSETKKRLAEILERCETKPKGPWSTDYAVRFANHARQDLPTLTRALLAVVDDCERDIDLCHRFGSSRTNLDIARYRRAKAVVDIIEAELAKGESQ